MTLIRLMELAYWGAGLREDVTADECQEIKEFAILWMDLAGHELEDIRLSQEDLREWDSSDN